jgi:hypothetical protein
MYLLVKATQTPMKEFVVNEPKFLHRAQKLDYRPKQMLLLLRDYYEKGGLGDVRQGTKKRSGA